MSESDTSATSDEASVDELAAAVRDLRDTVGSLRDDVRRANALPPEPPAAPEPDAHAWLSLVEAPRSRRLSVPRVLLEALFLVACAVVAGLADLEPVAIAGVMIGAWALVALIEWAASRADRAREQLLYGTPPVPVAVEASPGSDPAWYSPPAEQTMLDVAAIDATAVTRLPPRLEDDLEATSVELADVTIEQRPGTE